MYLQKEVKRIIKKTNEWNNEWAVEEALMKGIEDIKGAKVFYDDKKESMKIYTGFFSHEPPVFPVFLIFEYTKDKTIKYLKDEKINDKNKSCGYKTKLSNYCKNPNQQTFSSFIRQYKEEVIMKKHLFEPIKEDCFLEAIIEVLKKHKKIDKDDLNLIPVLQGQLQKYDFIKTACISSFDSNEILSFLIVDQNNKFFHYFWTSRYSHVFDFNRLEANHHLYQQLKENTAKALPVAPTAQSQFEKIKQELSDWINNDLTKLINVQWAKNKNDNYTYSEIEKEKQVKKSECTNIRTNMFFIEENNIKNIKNEIMFQIIQKIKSACFYKECNYNEKEMTILKHQLNVSAVNQPFFSNKLPKQIPVVLFVKNELQIKTDCNQIRFENFINDNEIIMSPVIDHKNPMGIVFTPYKIKPVFDETKEKLTGISFQYGIECPNEDFYSIIMVKPELNEDEWKDIEEFLD